MASRHRILLLIESHRSYGRGCLQGIASYSRTHGPWSFLHLDPGVTRQMLRSWCASWRPEGVLCRLTNPAHVSVLQSLALPMVEINPMEPDDPTATCFDTDSAKAARMAAEHLMARGFRHFGYCGHEGLSFSLSRCESFSALLAESGFTTHVFNGVGSPRQPGDTLEREAWREARGRALAAWLRSLPKPVGIMACNDMRGWQLLTACSEIDIKVPEEVAVLGVDNDEIICDLATPTLSSVEPDTPQLGYRAAEAMERILSGKPTAPGIIAIEPRGIVTRASTDVLAVEDPLVMEALRLIREGACDGLNVRELLERLRVSPSTLERRFEHGLKRSPKEEIQRVRVERIKRLLTETDHSLAEIAGLTGFKTTAQLSIAFKTLVGVPPGEFRDTTR